MLLADLHRDVDIEGLPELQSHRVQDLALPHGAVREQQLVPEAVDEGLLADLRGTQEDLEVIDVVIYQHLVLRGLIDHVLLLLVLTVAAHELRLEVALAIGFLAARWLQSQVDILDFGLRVDDNSGNYELG